MMSFLRRMRALYTFVAELFLLAFIAAIAVPVASVYSLRYLEPTVTAVILSRAWDRYLGDTRPILPTHVYLPLERISPRLRKMVVEAEDGRFYQHDGFDLESVRDALDDHLRGRKLRGASTITQQTAKNLFLWEGRSWVRKGLETGFTVLLEALLPKDRILEIYLNSAEWGDGIFGAEAAARHYFKKSAGDLTSDEAARLAAILPSPRKWRPTGPYAGRRAAQLLGIDTGAANPGDVNVASDSAISAQVAGDTGLSKEQQWKHGL